MHGITAGSLRLTGGFGIGEVKSFSMREYPGEHAWAEVTGTAQAQEDAAPGFFGEIRDRRVEVYAEGEERAVFSGVVLEAESLEESGCRLLRLGLASGSVLMDMTKEKRSFQDVSMTYGQIISGTAAEAGMTALCPPELDRTAAGFPIIQYRETDWEFIRRLASRFGLPVYPEPTLGGGKLSVGLPETGYSGPLGCLGYAARVDRKFYEVGGEKAGRERSQYRTFEVRSLELRRVGDGAQWNGESLLVCAREAETKGGVLDFPMSWRTGNGHGRSVWGTRRSPGCRCLGAWKGVPGRP